MRWSPLASTSVVLAAEPLASRRGGAAGKVVPSEDIAVGTSSDAAVTSVSGARSGCGRADWPIRFAAAGEGFGGLTGATGFEVS